MSFGVAVLVTLRELSCLRWKRQASAGRNSAPVRVALATAGAESAAGSKARASGLSVAARLNSLLKKFEKQIPHRLKSVRDDKKRGLLTAHPSTGSGQALKVRPFKTPEILFSQHPVKPAPSTCLLPFVFGLFCSTALAAQSPFAPKVSGPLSQRVVAYQIDAK